MNASKYEILSWKLLFYGKYLAADCRSFIYRFLPHPPIDKTLFIVGAQKAGTTSLYAYLESHPNIAIAGDKETGFFSKDSLFEKGGRYFRSLYPRNISGKYCIDATPEYSMYHNSADRIYDCFPSSKIIIILREPVARAYSAFNMYFRGYSFRREIFKTRLSYSNSDAKDYYLSLLEKKEITIDDFLARELEVMSNAELVDEPSLIRRSIYAPQIQRYINLFSEKNVLVLFSEDLKNNPREVLARIFRHIGVAPQFPTEFKMRHVLEYAADANAKKKIINVARELFNSDREALINDFGLKVPWSPV